MTSTSLPFSRAVAACTVLLAGCGDGRVHGEYIGKKGESFFDSLTFRSDGKVEVVLVGVHQQGTYDVDDENFVTIMTPNGDRNVLQLDANGCLTHPIAGTYCKRP